jgi:hypothetical protein
MNQCKALNAWPIQRKMVLLLLLIFLPASGILISLGIEQRAHGMMEAREHALLLAQSLATQQENIAASAKYMLSTLARLPEVQELDAQACDKIFRELNDLNPFFSVIAAVTADGTVFAGSVPVEGTVNLSDRKYIKDVIGSLGFSAGEYAVGRLSRTPSISYAHPVLDADGKLIAVVIAGFRLDAFDLFISANLYKDYAVTITDREGIHLYRSPDHQKPVSKDIFQRASGEPAQGIFEQTDGDGIERVYAFKQLRLTEGARPYLYMIVDIKRENILREVTFKMFRDLGLLLIAGLLALSLAWFYVHVALIAPIKHMVAGT